MITILYFLLAGLIGYFLGAIPFGYIYVKLKTGNDIRDVGSGRTGGTNSLRAAGLGVGLATGFSDVFKGYAAAWLTRYLFGDVAFLPWLIATAGIFSVIGHNWSVFMQWRGGAGTGPNVGWGTAVWGPMLPLGIVVMVGLLLSVGIASVASMAMAVIMLLAFLALYLAGVAPFDSTLAYIVGSFVTTAVILWALRPNIKRLRQGTERIVGPRARRLERAANADQ